MGQRGTRTEIDDAPEFYYAEDYHQQYLSPSKNPNGYCGVGGTGVACPVGLTACYRSALHPAGTGPLARLT